MGKRSEEWVFLKIQGSTCNADTDSKLTIDKVTWLQMINSALKLSLGTFGEGSEYYLLYCTENVALLKVNSIDERYFKAALATYISTEEYLAHNVILTIIQSVHSIKDIKVDESDLIWFNKVVEQEAEEESVISQL